MITPIKNNWADSTMFQIGLSELLLTGVIALIVLGPERLPELARFAGKTTAQLKKLWRHWQNNLLDETNKAPSEHSEHSENKNHEPKL